MAGIVAIEDQTALTVLVTGSRTWSDGSWVVRVLDTVRSTVDEMTLFHGAASEGADAHAEYWYRARKRAGDDGVGIRRFPAKWSRGGGAGLARNREMVDAKPDLVLAFLCRCKSASCKRAEPHGTHGASQCADYAEGSEIEVRWFRWEDR